MDIDRITLQILHSGFRSIADECFIALKNSAYSSNIKERRDCSAAIFDKGGRLIAQAEDSLPVHISSMVGILQAIMTKFNTDRIGEGDLFAANDPHVAGGTHLPDVCLAAPVFAEGHLVAYIATIAHHADIGGMAPGSMAGYMTEIYQEGLRIPPVRLFTQGRQNRDILDLFILNARVPEERKGDYFAQIAACRLGLRRLTEMIGTHGVETIETGFDRIIAHTERRMKAAIGEIADGVYTFEDVIDDNGLGSVDIPVRVKVTVEGQQICVDFRGTSAQVPGSMNSTINATTAAVCYTLKALLDPHVPNNQGVINAVTILAEPGSLVSATFPAAVANRTQTCQRIVDVLIGALANACPLAAVGAANGATTTVVFSGTDPRSQRPYVYLEAIGGGFGGRATKDGTDGVQVHITNSSNLPVEAIEMEYPLLVESYGFVEDSGGAGQFRGGLGLRRVIRPLGHVTSFNGTGERFRHRPWGIFGGGPGQSGSFVVQSDSGERIELPPKPGNTPIGPDQFLVVESAGAGGYGPPKQRAPAMLEDDLRSGKFSSEFIGEHYS